jgi:hypothetical protein
MGSGLVSGHGLAVSWDRLGRSRADGRVAYNLAMSRTTIALLAVALAMLSSAAWCQPQQEPSTARELLEPYGLETFPARHVKALETFLEVEAAYARGEYSACGSQLDRFWKDHPPGSSAWDYARGPVQEIFLGTPPCYYALRMLTDCVDWRLKEAEALDADEAPLPDPAMARLTVVLVGRGEGLEPRHVKDLQALRGRKRTPHIAPELLQDENRIVHESLGLFTEYVAAMTEGRLQVEASVLHLPELEVPLAVREGPPFRTAGLGEDAMSLIWAAVDEPTKAGTDWWWVIYPSIVPEAASDFETTEFITGGMAVGSDDVAPCFLIDDRWLLRKPPHLGAGPYTSIERRAYLPQWLQHEFFHHLFRTWPGFGLEVRGHQWFDRSTWPADFEGATEPDYYHEALHRRLRTEASPPLHVGLLNRPAAPELFLELTAEDLVGRYVREPTENDWHLAEVTIKGEGKRAKLRWSNRAGTSWKLEADLSVGLLHCGSDNPYHDPKDPSATDVRVVLDRTDSGDWLPSIAGLRFGGDFYALHR